MSIDQELTRRFNDYFNRTPSPAVLMVETYTAIGRLSNQYTVQTEEYPRLIERAEDGKFVMDKITFTYLDGSRMEITRP